MKRIADFAFSTWTGLIVMLAIGLPLDVLLYLDGKTVLLELLGCVQVAHIASWVQYRVRWHEGYDD